METQDVKPLTVQRTPDDQKWEYVVTPALLAKVWAHDPDEWFMGHPPDNLEPDTRLVMTPVQDKHPPKYRILWADSRHQLLDIHEPFGAIPAPPPQGEYAPKGDLLHELIESAALRGIDLADALPWEPSDVELEYYEWFSQA
jgi:hypothetical protein